MHVLPVNHRWLVFALLLSGFLLRIAFLDSKSLWLDEANALRVSYLEQTALWEGRGEGYHPPLFYKVLEFWRLLGEDETTLRLIAVIPSTLSIPLLYIFGSTLLNRSIALSATALVAFSPLLIWYAQEVRPYALLGFLTLATMLSASKLRQKPHPLWWLSFVSCLIAALYLHYFAILLIPLTVMLLVISWPTKQATWQGVGGIGLAFITAMAAYWPWLTSPAAQRFFDIAGSDRNYVAQLLTTRLDSLPLADQMYPILIMAGLVGTLLSFFAAYFFARTVVPSQRFQALNEWRWLQVALLLAYIVILVLVVWPRGYTIKRQLVMFWPFVLLGFGWFWPWRPKQKRIVVVILLCSLAASLINIILIPKPEWREANAYILANQQVNDMAVLEPTYMTIPFNYYNENRSLHRGVRFGLSDDALQELSDAHGRIWQVIDLNDMDPQQLNANWLDAHMNLISITNFYKLQIRLYERP